ncbi:MAG: MarR family transcriptional regulator [Desulfobacter sp.]|nr:MarR family transcriptional regulator [Desulfobacter sp.]WDP87366.1 MAG: MarR family transcriptional regulator [Desulfobacter sp.]
MIEKQKIHGKFRSIMELALELEKKPRKFGTDKDLSHSEIHLIEIIGDHEGLSVTEISKLIGVTKGAISQSLKRLEKKGLTAKSTDPDNLSRVLVDLTAKGKTAHWAHKDWHENMDGGFNRYLEALDMEKTKFILEFLTRTEDFLHRRLNASE